MDMTIVMHFFKLFVLRETESCSDDVSAWFRSGCHVCDFYV